MTAVRWGRSVSREWVRSEAGRGSNSQVLMADFFMIFLTVSSETGVKDERRVPEKEGSEKDDWEPGLESRD